MACRALPDRGDVRYSGAGLHGTHLTREPGEEIRFIHDRMPVILPKDTVDAWIKPDSDPEEVVKKAMVDMIFEKAIA